jgi:hypothetical protein
MSEPEATRSVVVATTNCEKALYIIAKDAMNYDELELHFTERYAPTVEYLLRMLRKAFGWMEADRGMKEVANTKCQHNINGFCECAKVTKDAGSKGQLRCTEAVRVNCKHHVARFSNKLTVNYVMIEKAGQIRDM